MATIQEMLGQIEKREVLLPEFQRGYVWGKDQVRGFIRSLYRAHPTGHFLIWKTYTPPRVRVERVRLTPIRSCCSTGNSA